MTSRPALIFLLTAAAMGQPSGAREVLVSSTDRDALERAASALARSGDAASVAYLGQLLRDPAFLARLDDLSTLKTFHLGQVMSALAEHPTPPIVELCLALAEDPVFTAEGDRKSFALEILAAVKPMSERTAAVFQRANEEGYFGFNARLIAANGSPRALALFESMMLDKRQPVESRIECLHVGILPRRTEGAILAAADRVLSRTSESAIAGAVIESVFDFRQQWFGLESGIGRPPGWQAAPPSALRPALALADKALARRDLKPSLRQAVANSRAAIAQSLRK
jgi:hypothetical protein